MLTVIMECRDQEPELAHTLSTLVSGAVEGLVSDVIILDHGSTDGSSRVAEAAGCRFETDWDMGQIIASARGEWILLMELGGRPQSGWIEDIMEYTALNTRPARFAPSRHYRPSLLSRLTHRSRPLEYGLLLRKADAVAQSSGRLGRIGLDIFLKGQKARRLSAELIPAWALRRAS
ncbi:MULTISPECIES: glycosyl transferase [unclassified Rhizobium]|uniref:glycosyl transferase n=1 Tax=unclassified Rhizobium TaxID=2613769 RepID=UPI00177F3DE7|nr:MULTISPECIES: glycosyl transferase [unclassified Rhizobium]MBD8685789.1 glycosyl transferase [Rhizobium sp. CFBP 13644]MBD8690538.1 glycosyl transferase [Rhizobium sp. CFBP 13717]